MLARVGGGQAFVPQPLFFFPHLPPAKHLCFQQNSRFIGLSTCVFIDIPASLRTLESRPFVFIDIPASLRQKKNSFFKFLRRFDPSDKLSDRCWRALTLAVVYCELRYQQLK